MARLDQDLFERIQASEADDEVGLRITDRIAALVAPLEAERDQLLAEKAACRAYMHRIDKQMRRVDRVLAAASTTTNPQPETKSSKNGKVGTGRPAPEKLNRVLKVIAEADHPLTNKEIHEVSGLTKPTTNAATYWLRKEGRIRLAGYGGPTNQSALYAPVETPVEVVAA